MSKNEITFQVSGEEGVPADGAVTPKTKLYINEGPIPNKVICDHVNACEIASCGHNTPHEFHAEICEIDHDGKPMECEFVGGDVIKCVVDPIALRLDMLEKSIEVLRGLERRMVCPSCFHIRKAGHSRKCEIMKLLDDYDDLG